MFGLVQNYLCFFANFPNFMKALFCKGLKKLFSGLLFSSAGRPVGKKKCQLTPSPKLCFGRWSPAARRRDSGTSALPRFPA